MQLAGRGRPIFFTFRFLIFVSLFRFSVFYLHFLFSVLIHFPFSVFFGLRIAFFVRIPVRMYYEV